jgi:hypothetical protein
MNNRKILLVFAILLLVISACGDKNDPPTVTTEQLQVTMQPTWGTSDLALDQVFTTSEGYRVQLTDLKCYFAALGSSTKSLTDAALYDFRETGKLVVKKNGKRADFTNLQAFLGVEEANNHADPTAFPNQHPLNISVANDMHLGWNPGYIFIKFEAKVDTINDGIDNFNHFVIFHIGKDNLLQTLSFPTVNWNATGTGIFTLPLKFDVATFLQNGQQTIDLKQEFTSHTAPGQEAISAKVIQNFKAAIQLY